MRQQVQVEPRSRASLTAVETGDLREESQVVSRNMPDSQNAEKVAFLNALFLVSPEHLSSSKNAATLCVATANAQVSSPV